MLRNFRAAHDVLLLLSCGIYIYKTQVKTWLLYKLGTVALSYHQTTITLVWLIATKQSTTDLTSATSQSKQISNVLTTKTTTLLSVHIIALTRRSPGEIVECET